MMEDDVDMSTLIKTPEITVDWEATNAFTAIAHDVFDGILEVERRHWWWWGMELTHPYIDLRGFENMLVDFYDYPEKIHEILNLFTEGYMAKLDYLEENGLLIREGHKVKIVQKQYASMRAHLDKILSDPPK